MKRISWLFTLTSLSVLLVTVERFSFTTQIILQPYNYLRLHEVIQMVVIILLTIIIPSLILKEVTNNFSLFKSTRGQILALMFLVGVYFYATGNGVHEIASYLFNTFCDVKNFRTIECGAMFFNDYYFGNILYFIGAYLFTISIMLFERMNPNKNFTRRDLIPLVINAVVYGFAVFAYAAFDIVEVGITYSIVTTLSILVLLLTAKSKPLSYPYTLYGAIAYGGGTLASLIVRYLI